MSVFRSQPIMRPALRNANRREVCRGGLAPRYRYQTPGKPLPDLFEILPQTERHASYSADNEHLLVSKVRTNWLNFSTRILTEATCSISCPAIFANALSTTFIKDTVRVYVTTCSVARIIHWRFKGTKTVKSNTTIFHWGGILSSNFLMRVRSILNFAKDFASEILLNPL